MVHYLVLILEPQIHQTHLPRLLRPLLLQVMLQLKVQYQRLLEQLVHRFQVELLQVVGLLLLPLRPLLLLVLGSLGHPPLTNLLQLLLFPPLLIPPLQLIPLLLLKNLLLQQLLQQLLPMFLLLLHQILLLKLLLEILLAVDLVVVEPLAV